MAQDRISEEAETDRQVDEWYKRDDDPIPLPVALEILRRVSAGIEAIDGGGGVMAAPVDGGGSGVV